MITRGIVCDGDCGRRVEFGFRPENGRTRITEAEMNRAAREKGWQAPDKLGRHFCPSCRRPDGRPDRGR